MRAILVTVRYPESRAINAEHRQTAPTVDVKLLATMTIVTTASNRCLRGAIPSRSRACTRPAELMVVFPM